MRTHTRAALAFLVFVAAGAGLLALIVYRVLDSLGPIFGN